MFSEVFQKFFGKNLFAAALLLLASGGTAAEFTADGVELPPCDQATLRALRDLDRQLCGLFRVSSRRPGAVRCRIAFSNQLPPGTVRCEEKNRLRTVEFNPSSGGWRDDFALRKRLLGHLFAAKCGIEAPRNPDFFPDWAVAGIDARLLAARHAERLMRNNRYWPVLRCGCEIGALPDFRRMMELPFLQLPPAAGLWYGELSRLLLETAADDSSPVDNALADYVILRASAKGTEAEIFRATLGRVLLAAADRKLPLRCRDGWTELSDDAKIQRYLEFAAERAAYHEYFPKPPARMSGEFRRVRDLEYPSSDDPENPGNATLTAALERMPDVLLDRRDAAELKSRKSRELESILAGADPEFARELHELSAAVLRLPERSADRSRTAEAELARALARVEETLRRIESRELWLDEMELRFRSPFERNAVELDIVGRPDPVLSEKAAAYLEETERFYLDE